MTYSTGADMDVATAVQASGIDFDAHPQGQGILTPEALEFVAELSYRFERRRRQLLRARIERQQDLDCGRMPDFLDGTVKVREGDWSVPPVPKALEDRRVEITGPVDRKMMINALNSGAKVFMADFEDANSPTWDNVVQGQVNVRDYYHGVLSLAVGEKEYWLNDETATMMIRPRGWHLVEKHVRCGGEPVSASLFDFGISFFHSAVVATRNGTGPFFYLPKLESHLEARLWNDVFCFSQEELGIPRGTIKATVLVETILAAFAMDEILYELREHSAGLNAGRWDYIFSVLKKMSAHSGFMLPDRCDVTMTVPFMRAYVALMVRTCHRRGAHAIGGMSAFVPNRRDPEVTERALKAVAEDKAREAADGCDGTWVAHPDLVAVARKEFDAVMGDSPNQLQCLREDVEVTAADLLAIDRTGGSISESGVRTNVSVGLRYLVSWLTGVGAVAIDNLMEDVATAEISRAQLWQWRTHNASTVEGTAITAEYLRSVIGEEVAAIASAGADPVALRSASAVFEGIVLGESFVPFLTIPAYKYLAERSPRTIR